MSIQPVWQETLDFFGMPLVLQPSAGQLSSDAGLLPFRQLDQHLGLTHDFAAVLHDPRQPDLIEHTNLEMVRSRVYGILAGYEDQNDPDTLRTDPLFKLVADRSPDAPDLASQPTLSRFENAIDIPALKRLRQLFVDQFMASFEQAPRRLTFDLDAVDAPAHGHQQLTFWHGYYDQNQYLPLFISCPDNDPFVMLSLRPGHVHASLDVCFRSSPPLGFGSLVRPRWIQETLPAGAFRADADSATLLLAAALGERGSAYQWLTGIGPALGVSLLGVVPF